MQHPNSISAFDVIGPKMIGPSSSHTAGALRIALLARSLAAGERIVEVKFTLYGSFSRTYRGHGTDRALLAGIMGLDSFDERIRESEALATEQGLQYMFVLDDQKQTRHPNTADIQFRTEKGREIQVRGESIGGGQALISKINGTEVEFTGNYHTIVVNNTDTPGVVAKLSLLLAQEHINIAFMRLYREAKGDMAFTLIECDEAIPERISRQLSELEEVKRAIVVAAVR